MSPYATQAVIECQAWQQKMLKRSGVINILSKKLQEKINSYIPEKIHEAITYMIRQMSAPFYSEQRRSVPNHLPENRLKNASFSFYKK